MLRDPESSPEQWGRGAGEASPRNKLFLQGPQRRGFELGQALSIFWEMIRGFRTLHFVGPCVTVFGSARFPEDHEYYKLARAVGSELSRAGFTVMTGGGPGIMEAANRGARDVGGLSLGCNIKLPKEQQHNPYLDKWITFNSFAVRKIMLVKYSYAFIACPGGFGTLDEVFETATLIQTGKIDDFPIILMGKDYWAPLVKFCREQMVRERTIDPIDIDRIMVSDSPEEVVAFVREHSMSRFGLTYGPKIKRKWYLGE